MPIEVVLEREDLRWASDIALQRITRAELAGMASRFAYSGDRDGLNTHALGCMGELAFARAMGLEWPAHVDKFRMPGYPDVFPFWEVRWASSLKSLPVKPDDPPHYLAVFVTGRPPGFEVHGFINTGWAQQNLPAVDRPDKNGVPRKRPAHWIDAYNLSPIEEDFHQTCGWINGYGDREGWLCLYCGKELP
jgi:hypothetical protein